MRCFIMQFVFFFAALYYSFPSKSKHLPHYHVFRHLQPILSQLLENVTTQECTDIPQIPVHAVKTYRPRGRRGIAPLVLNHNTRWRWDSFIHSVFCLTTGAKPPPKRCLHIVRSRASSFKWEYPLLSLRSSSSFLRLLPRLLATSPFIFPSIICFRRHFLRKMLTIQLAFRFLISWRIFLC